MNRHTFFFSLPLERYSSEDIRRIQKAYYLAKEGHSKQKRDDGVRYFEHPRSVALILVEMNYADVNTICAALLHDGVEDTFIPPDIYLDTLGPMIWHWIATLSKKIPAFDPLTGQVIGYVKREIADYFNGINALPPKARVIKLADRLHNLRTCEAWEKDRQLRYVTETRVHILPIARATDQAFVEALEAELDIITKRCTA
jgi:GTP diphosphokinase / guanosine-3',5'-bis(diphosphate) 3'-diphosphatase